MKDSAPRLSPVKSVEVLRWSPSLGRSHPHHWGPVGSADGPVVIASSALIVLGPGKLPEVGANLGEAIRGFRHAASGNDEKLRPRSTPHAS